MTRGAWVAFGTGGAAAMATLVACVFLSPDPSAPPPPPAPPSPPPAACAKWRVPKQVEIPTDVVKRAYALLPQKNGYRVVEWWSGKWWRFTRAPHAPDVHIPFWHPGTNVEVCADAVA